MTLTQLTLLAQDLNICVLGAGSSVNPVLFALIVLENDPTLSRSVDINGALLIDSSERAR